MNYFFDSVEKEDLKKEKINLKSKIYILKDVHKIYDKYPIKSVNDILHLIGLHQKPFVAKKRKDLLLLKDAFTPTNNIFIITSRPCEWVEYKINMFFLEEDFNVDLRKLSLSILSEMKDNELFI
jgi:hypothetical protein